ncbi:BadF/BadG/BcrA/BcrD type ATPase [Oceaniovalibus guishaninsula JLT2003]|uniref:BadF/BadG/BcrA/BcrD type ATPase n=1 Tax=Oceaniovalibus guishaninsula JLT2003 TaxID=1231392 RepID=K2GK76_9RHOB|nr:BadF/BadG/BcrA/BcrD type ATPase [Oceaniovalibus guishaninsula JLT2003]
MYLGVDMGGTASRWVALDESGGVAARGQGRGASGLIHDAPGLAAFDGALADIRAALPDRAIAAHLGITGAGFSPHPLIEERVGAVFGLPRARFGYSTDIVLAWHAAFPQGGGCLVSAGTGSVGIFIDAGGAATVVGGRGVLVDDGGSGAWIALRAIARLFRVIDDHGHPEGAERLAAALFTGIGGSDRDALRAFVHGGDRGRIGMLAVPVAQAARAGDPLALAVIEDAGGELVRLARALLGRGGPAPVAFVGGVLGLHPAIRRRIERDLAGTVAFPRIDAALHAAHIARQKDLTA